ncbi:MAG: type II toxin-antitoxin system VapC family toxin [Planctomycetes bacterium]|nr:type II toxin-antitoxin system VapC family toxin [Planctomycetota bacterium]
MIVLDASVVLEVHLRTEASDRILARISKAERHVHAPELLDVEVAQVLRHYERSKSITAERDQSSLALLEVFPLDRHPHLPLLGRIWELQANVTAYDACYLALAEPLDETLLTCDRKLAIAPGHRARVELI